MVIFNLFFFCHVFIMVWAWHNHYDFILIHTNNISIDFIAGDVIYKTLRMSEKKLLYIFTSYVQIVNKPTQISLINHVYAKEVLIEQLFPDACFKKSYICILQGLFLNKIQLTFIILHKLQHDQTRKKNYWFSRCFSNSNWFSSVFKLTIERDRLWGNFLLIIRGTLGH